MSDHVEKTDGLNESLEHRYENLLNLANSAKTKKDMLTSKQAEYAQEVADLQTENIVLEKVEELYKFLLDKYVHQYAESFSDVVTEGLQSIFYDQDIRLDLNVTDKHGKVWVEFETVRDGHKGHPLESFGGGVAAVQSLLLRILVMLKKDLARYLILDESLAALADYYVPNAGEFISSMCEKTGIDVLLITHNKEFLEHCDQSYNASLEDGALVLDKR